MFSSVAVQHQHPVNTEANKYWNILVASFLYFSLSRQRRMERYQPASDLNFSTRQRDQSPSWSTPVQVWRVLWCWIKCRLKSLRLKTDVIGHMMVWSRGPETEVCRNMCELILKIHSVISHLYRWTLMKWCCELRYRWRSHTCNTCNILRKQNRNSCLQFKDAMWNVGEDSWR